MKQQILPFTFGCLVLVFCVYLLNTGYAKIIVDVIWASVIGTCVVAVAFVTINYHKGKRNTKTKHQGFKDE